MGKHPICYLRGAPLSPASGAQSRNKAILHMQGKSGDQREWLGERNVACAEEAQCETRGFWGHGMMRLCLVGFSRSLRLCPMFLIRFSENGKSVTNEDGAPSDPRQSPYPQFVTGDWGEA
jgi:hypothetical protein